MNSDPHLPGATPASPTPLRRTRSKLFLLAPLIIVFVMVLGILDLVMWQKTGVSVIAVALVIIALSGGRRREEAIVQQMEAAEAELDRPEEAALLNVIEPWLYIVLALVMTPASSRLIVRMVSGPDPGELGFGGIIFIVGGFAATLVVAFSAIMIQRFYVQDDYRIRWGINLAAVAGAIAVIAL